MLGVRPYFMSMSIIDRYYEAETLELNDTGTAVCRALGPGAWLSSELLTSRGTVTCHSSQQLKTLNLALRKSAITWKEVCDIGQRTERDQEEEKVKQRAKSD